MIARRQWEGEIEISELAVCGRPDFSRGVTEHFLRKEGRAWRPAVKVGTARNASA